MTTAPPLPVRIHDRVQAEAVLACARDLALIVELVSAEGAACYCGVGYFRALEALLDRPILVDCGDDAAVVMAGLRVGLKRLLFTGAAPALDKLQGMADQQGAIVCAAIAGPVVALHPDQDPRAALSAAI